MSAAPRPTAPTPAGAGTPGAPLAGALLWGGLTYVAAAVGGIASATAAGFYAELERPAWAPPPWLFGPVWTALYVMMGVAAWLVWRRAGWRGARGALLLYAAQLVLNALWTWLFFRWRNGGWAFLEVLVLWDAVALTAWAFRRVRPIAAALLLPYLAWVTFAAALTWAVWRRNPALL